MAAAFINGLQSKGVAGTIKHFVGNDQEHERTAAESVMSERALREIYLYPFVTREAPLIPPSEFLITRFMLAQKLAQPWAYMTA